MSTPGYFAIRHRCAFRRVQDRVVVELSGADASSLLDHAAARDVALLPAGRSRLTLMLADDGAVFDIVMVMRPDSSRFLLVPTADAGRLHDHLAATNDRRSVRMVISDLRLLQIEGPGASDVLREIVGPTVAALAFQTLRTVSIFGHESLVLRNGVSGEFGYEIYGCAELLNMLVERLRSVGAIEAAADDWRTAMLEVRQPVPEQAAGGSYTVPELGWTWLTSPMKPDFAGVSELRSHLAQQRRRSLLITSDEEPIVEALVSIGDTQLGRVIEARYSPTLSQWLSLGIVERTHGAVGLNFQISGTTNGGRSISSPAVLPTSWRSITQ